MREGCKIRNFHEKINHVFLVFLKQEARDDRAAGSQKRIPPALFANSGGGAVAGEKEGLIRQRGEGGAQVAQGLLIDGGRGAAADGTGEQGVSGDEHWSLQALDVETERGSEVA